MVRVRYVIPNTLLKNNNIFGFWMYFIRFFFGIFSSLTTISLIKKKAMDIQGGLYDQKQRKRKKKHEMQYFLWIIYQFWGFFLLFCGRKIFSKTKSLFPTFHNSTIQCSYPFGDDYYNGFFTINYMIDFSGQFCQTKVLNEKFWAISLTELWNQNKDLQTKKK